VSAALSCPNRPNLLTHPTGLFYNVRGYAPLLCSPSDRPLFQHLWWYAYCSVRWQHASSLIECGVRPERGATRGKSRLFKAPNSSLMFFVQTRTFLVDGALSSGLNLRDAEISSTLPSTISSLSSLTLTKLAPTHSRPVPPSTIHKLPFELLSLIFLHYIQSDSPWTLSHVSRLWRTVTLSTPRLWAGVRIAGIRSREGSKTPRWSDGLEYCDSVPRLQSALARAGAVPLDVCIGTHDFYHVYVTQEENAENERTREALFEECCKIGVDNWRSLEIARCWVLHFTGVDGLLHGRFASLEELSICGFQSSALHHLLADAPRLRTITLRHVCLRPYAVLPFWSKIRSFSLVRAFLFDDDEFDAFATILEASQSLESLQIELKDIHRPQWAPLHSRRPVMLQHLRSLTYRGLWAIPIVAPNLVQLAIEDIRLPELLQTKHLDGAPFIEMPHLIQLSLSRTLISDLPILRAQRLKDLTLRSMVKPNTDEGLASVWSHETGEKPGNGRCLFPALSILRLEDFTASFTVLRSALECLSPQLHQLHFKNCLLPRTFFRVFCSGSPRHSSFSTSTSTSTSTSSTQMSHSPPPLSPPPPPPRQTRYLCPSLETMTIVVHEMARADKDVIRPALLDFVHMRKIAGLNLNSLTVDWDESGKREEFVQQRELSKSVMQ
jgi:hypothetical protein